MTAPVLRPYQTLAIERVEAAWTRGVRRPAVVLPTSAGKTVIFAALIDRWRENNPGRRVVVLAHRGELLEQAASKLTDRMPTASLGRVKADADETDADILLCSVQTLAVAGRVERLTDVGLVVCDEAHHYASKEWRQVLTRLGCFDRDDVVTAGFTATMSRSDGGLGAVWQEVVYTRDILRMIMDGHLCDVRGEAITVDGLDLATVARKAGGDFADGSLSDAMLASDTPALIAKAYTEHAGKRQGVVFGPTVAFAHAMSEALDAAGIPSAVISGETPNDVRRKLYAQYQAGEIRVLSNCMVLTEGWDAPWAEVAVIARPTQSSALYTQMVGRVLRLWPGKEQALVLDVCGAASDNTLASLIDLSEDAVPMRRGESLGKAVERAAKETMRRGGQPAIGDMSTRQVSMFQRQTGMWLLTERRHTPFIRTMRFTFLLWPAPEPGQWLIGRFHNKIGDVRSTGVWMRDGTWTMARDTATPLDLDRAVAWANSEAMDSDPSIAGKGSSWRKKGASRGMIEFASSLCLDFSELPQAPRGSGVPRAGELSDLLNRRLVTIALKG